MHPNMIQPRTDILRGEATTVTLANQRNRPVYVYADGSAWLDSWNDGKVTSPRYFPAGAAEWRVINADATYQAWREKQNVIAERRAEREDLTTRAAREGKRAYVRYGRIPKGGHSYNYRDNHAEAGVSVYPAWIMPDASVVIDSRGIDVMGPLLFADRPLMIVTGTVLDERGSDGEPLLANARCRKWITGADTQVVF